MGVPKFFRWLSERYPCLSQVVKEHQIPEFDNLYLDMNGIIHPCSHPNDDDPHFRISEADIFKNIFNYVDVLFRIIKPKQNFFMAVDGCAPRAKMNQQRGRRFKTAKEAEENIRKALQKGQTLPSEERFDSNCITPGTEFMARLQIQLKYFVNHKISSDPLWRSCNVYLSGHDVPGEGEHKIMDFIRYSKSRSDYDPNTRHCLYGLDADLIMLGLTAHEPHFALLREEIIYGKSSQRIVKPDEQTFHLLHLSLLREYIDLEFGESLRSEISFPYDLERIIDDWILMGFLVGNDFVPHLPNMHINQDALAYLFEVYKKQLPIMEGYLHDGGYLNLPRLKNYLQALGKWDRDRFQTFYDDHKWLENKVTGRLLHGNEKASSSKRQSGFKAPSRSMNTSNLDVLDDAESFETEFRQHKRHYYMEKFEFDGTDSGFVNGVCHEYVRAIQWILHYYFNGLQSWSWYYPYHYSPYVSDVAEFDVERELAFDLAQPFKPFEQLLAVLPASSRKLLPEAFQSLMIMDNSPIIDYYPAEFSTDLNGKQHAWEAVVLIPFIDEKRLLSAMSHHYSRLTDEEKARNSFGVAFRFSYEKELNFVYPSSYPGVFDGIQKCQARYEEIPKDKFRLDVSQLRKGLMTGTKLDVYFPGFPTTKHIAHKSYLKKCGVRVFQQNSKGDNMILELQNSTDGVNLVQLANSLLGKTAYVEWPYLVEALIVSVSDLSMKYNLNAAGQVEAVYLQKESSAEVARQMKSVSSFYLERRGVKVGDVTILVEARILLGQRYNCGQKGKVSLDKEWQETLTPYAYQTVVQEICVETSSRQVVDSIDQLYPIGQIVFMMASPHYGCSGEVLEVDKNAGRVRVALKVTAEPDFSEIMKFYDQLTITYIPDREVAYKLGISNHLLSRITGDVYLKERSDGSDSQRGINIGLQLKYSGQNKEVAGFTRRLESGWSYSQAAIDVLFSYRKEFPDVFQALDQDLGRDDYCIETLFPGKSKLYMEKIRSFLKSLPSYNADTVRCGSNALDQPVVAHIEDALAKVSRSEKKLVTVKVKAHLLFRPTEHFGKLAPDPETEFFLLDRVVNVKTGGTVPFGLRGTVIGYREDANDKKDKGSQTETRYEVLFDESFMGGVRMRSREKCCYVMSAASLLNISFGERVEKEKHGVARTSPMEFQIRISQSPSKSLVGKRDAASTPRSQDDKRRSYSTPTPSRILDAKSGRHETPTGSKHWLKGEYSDSRSFSSPARENSSPTVTPTRAAGGLPTPKYSSESDFLKMWQAMQTSDSSERSGHIVSSPSILGDDGSVPASPISKLFADMQTAHEQWQREANVIKESPDSSDKDGTAMLQQMLRIKQNSSAIPSSPSVTSSAASSPLSMHQAHRAKINQPTPTQSQIVPPVPGPPRLLHGSAVQLPRVSPQLAAYNQTYAPHQSPPFRMQHASPNRQFTAASPRHSPVGMRMPYTNISSRHFLSSPPLPLPQASSGMSPFILAGGSVSLPPPGENWHQLMFMQRPPFMYPNTNQQYMHLDSTLSPYLPGPVIGGQRQQLSGLNPALPNGQLRHQSLPTGGYETSECPVQSNRYPSQSDDCVFHSLVSDQQSPLDRGTPRNEAKNLFVPHQVAVKGKTPQKPSISSTGSSAGDNDLLSPSSQESDVDVKSLQQMKIGDDHAGQLTDHPKLAKDSKLDTLLPNADLGCSFVGRRGSGDSLIQPTQPSRPRNPADRPSVDSPSSFSLVEVEGSAPPADSVTQLSCRDPPGGSCRKAQRLLAPSFFGPKKK